MKPDRFQQAAIDDMRSGSGNTVVAARAGSGKTSTILAGLEELSSHQTVLLCCFNRDVRDELKRRAPDYVLVQTLHQLGYRALDNALRISVDKNRGYTIARQVLIDMMRHAKDDIEFNAVHGQLAKLAGKAKNCHVRSLEDIADLAVQDGIVIDGLSTERLAQAVAECLQRATAAPRTPDRDDLIYLPAKLGILPPRFHNVIVDELQDVNAAQLWLAGAACVGRFFGVGDEKQAIYRFRGADQNAMLRVITEANAKVLPLSVTYRCSLAVVDYVRRECDVPDLEAMPGAPNGLVDRRQRKELLGPYGPKPGDFVLSRLNAPLMNLCLHFLRHGVPAYVAGKQDLGDILLARLRKVARDVGANSLVTPVPKSEVLTALQDQHLQARAKLRERGAEPAEHRKAANDLDELEALIACVDNAESIADAKSFIFRAFESRDPATAVACSTVHKAKGLERRRVWVLRDTFFVGSDLVEEANLYYVACTRAKEDLLITSGFRPAWADPET